MPSRSAPEPCSPTIRPSPPATATPCCRTSRSRWSSGRGPPLPTPRCTRHPHSPLFFDTHDLHTVVADLHTRGVQSLFVEGGPTLASAFLQAGLADRLLVYIAPVLLGGGRLALTDIGVASIGEARRLTIDEWVPLGSDLLAIAHPAHDAHPRHEGAA